VASAHCTWQNPAWAPSHAPDWLATVRSARRVAIRAGSAAHRFTSLWAVVVGDRVFVRSWSVKPRSWYRTLLVEPHGVLQLKEREVGFRSVHTRSDIVKAAVDQAYVLKYDHPGDIPYVKDMTGPKSRATTRSRAGRAQGRGAPIANRSRSPRTSSIPPEIAGVAISG
jgi:hypothetical protein